MSNNSLQILSHYVEGEPSQDSEPNFLLLDRMMDHEEVLALYDQERQGHALCVTESPWINIRNISRRQNDGVTYSELVSVDDGDFRSSLDFEECNCSGGKVCIVCCTNRDLLDVPKSVELTRIQKVNLRVRAIGDRLEPVFDLVMSRGVARRMGLLPSEQ